MQAAGLPADSGLERVARSSVRTEFHGWDRRRAIGVPGNLRMRAGTSGFGDISTRSSSILRLVLRAARVEKYLAILIRQVRSELSQPRQMKTSIAQHLEELRVLP